jgi:hypothetical protein
MCFWQKELINHEFSNLDSNHSLTHCHNLKVFSALSCSVLIEGSGTAYTALIDSDSNTDSWPAYKNPFILRFELLGKSLREQGIMAGYFLVSTDVKHFVFKAAQMLLDYVFQTKSCMVRTEDDSFYHYQFIV